MFTAALLAVTFGPCLAFCGWVLKIASGTPEEERRKARLKIAGNYRTRFFSAVEQHKGKRAQAIKDWLAYEERMQQAAKANPDEFQ
jgi:hypothetical protein